MSRCAQEDPWIGWFNYKLVFFKTKTFLPLQQQQKMYFVAESKATNPLSFSLTRFNLVARLVVTLIFLCSLPQGLQLFLWLILMYIFFLN